MFSAQLVYFGLNIGCGFKIKDEVTSLEHSNPLRHPECVTVESWRQRQRARVCRVRLSSGHLTNGIV